MEIYGNMADNYNSTGYSSSKLSGAGHVSALYYDQYVAHALMDLSMKLAPPPDMFRSTLPT